MLLKKKRNYHETIHDGYVFANRISRRKIQSLHSQKSSRWAQQMYVTKENNCYSECCKHVLYTDPQYFDKRKPELFPKPDPTRNARPDFNFDAYFIQSLLLELYFYISGLGAFTYYENTIGDVKQSCGCFWRGIAKMITESIFPNILAGLFLFVTE